MPASDVAVMKVAELKAALKQRGLPTAGLKAELAARLSEALSHEQDGGEDAVEEEEDDGLVDGDPAHADASPAGGLTTTNRTQSGADYRVDAHARTRFVAARPSHEHVP